MRENVRLLAIFLPFSQGSSEFHGCCCEIEGFDDKEIVNARVCEEKKRWPKKFNDEKSKIDVKIKTIDNAAVTLRRAAREYVYYIPGPCSFLL